MITAGSTTYSEYYRTQTGFESGDCQSVAKRFYSCDPVNTRLSVKPATSGATARPQPNLHPSRAFGPMGDQVYAAFNNRLGCGLGACERVALEGPVVRIALNIAGLSGDPSWMASHD